MPIQAKYRIKTRENQTLETPAALLLSFNPLDTSVSAGIGYMFLAHTRQMIIAGSQKETLFWDFCKPCYKYNQKTCSGGLKTLTSHLRHSNPSHSFVDGKGRNRTHYYSSEICTPYAGSQELDRALQDPDPIQVPLPNYAFMIWSSQDYIFATKGTEAGFQFAPLRLFNTSSDGCICTGTTTSATRGDTSLAARVERFMNGRKNIDLMPKPIRMTLVDWVRNYDPEALAQERYWAMWKDGFNRYEINNSEKHLFLTDIYSKVVFLRINYGDIPGGNIKAKVRQLSGRTSIRANSVVVLPFLKKTGLNQVVCALDVSEIVNISDYPEIRGEFSDAL